MITQGMTIYYTGDVCNSNGWFTVTAIETTRWGTHATLAEIESEYSEGRTIKGLSLTQFGDRYEGHAGTRFVTKLAYDNYKAVRLCRNGTRDCFCAVGGEAECLGRVPAGC